MGNPGTDKHTEVRGFPPSLKGLPRVDYPMLAGLFGQLPYVAVAAAPRRKGDSPASGRLRLGADVRPTKRSTPDFGSAPIR